MKRSQIDEILARFGILPAPDDDPRYHEGTSITFVSKTLKSKPSSLAAESEPSEDDGPDPELCPFCGSDTCAHHAASLDLTFREVLGGALYDDCLAYLQRITDELSDGGEADDAHEDAFASLEQALDDLPGVVGVDSEWEGGPGQSSSVRHYWVDEADAIPALASRIGSMQA